MTRDQQTALLVEYLLATHAPTVPAPSDVHYRPVAGSVTHIFDLHGAVHYLGVLCGFPEEIYNEAAVEKLAKKLFALPEQKEYGCLFYCKATIADTPESFLAYQENYYRLWKLRVLEEVLKDLTPL